MEVSKIEETPRPNSLVEQIAPFLLKRGNFGETIPTLHQFKNSPIGLKIQQSISKGQPIHFVLPAFPAKAPNPQKTTGPEPDLGEVLGLINLHALCEEISQVYSAGAEVWICSDGAVFSDLVHVSEENLAIYKIKIQEILREFHLDKLKTFDLEDFIEAKDLCSKRKILEEKFAPSLEVIKDLIKTDQIAKNMFNGIHRFIQEDRKILFPHKSKNQTNKESKYIAYKVIQRSRSWDNLLEIELPETARLSIHPYPIYHHKFGIKLVQSSNLWATPWHNVVLKTESETTLVKRSQAIELGAIEKSFKQKYKFYEI